MRKMKICLRFLVLCLAFLAMFTMKQTVHAETLTGRVVISGDVVAGNKITATLVDSNNTDPSKLSYSWYLKSPLSSINMEAYHQQSYTLLSTDAGRQICCIIKSSEFEGQVTSGYITVSGSSTSTKPVLTGTLEADGVSLSWTGSGRTYVYRKAVEVSGASWVCVNPSSPVTSGNTYKAPLPPTNDLWHYRVDVAGVSSTEIEIDTRNGGGGSYIDKTITITQHPQSQTVDSGSAVTFACDATGYDLTFTWQESYDGNSWNDLNALYGKTITLAVTNDMNGRKYRCKITNSGNTVYTNAATLSFNAAFGITRQPSNQYITEGNTVSFSLSASGNGLTYQWQKSTNNGVDWVNTSSTGSTTDTMSLAAKYSFNSYLFRCIVKDSKGNSVTSNSVKMIVSSVYPYFTSQPADVTVDAGNIVTFKVAAYGVNLKYQWQKSSNGSDWTNSSSTGATSATLSMTAKASFNGMKFRCIVTTTDGKKITSNEAKLTVKSTVPVITVNPVDTKVNVGEMAYFTVSASGNNLSYQWQKSTNGGTSWANSGSTGAQTTNMSLLTKISYDGWMFRCKVTDKTTNKSTYSKAVTLTVKPLISITSQPSNVSVAVGNKAIFQVAADGDGLTYQWQKSTNGGETWANSSSSGAKTEKLSMTAKISFNGLKFRCKITDSKGNIAYSNVVTLSVSTQ